MIKPAIDIFKTAAGTFKPPPEIPWWEWAREGGLIIPPRVPTPCPGPYDIMVIPAMLGVAMRLDEAETINLVLLKGTQIGGTQLAYAWLLSRIIYGPAPALMVSSNGQLCKQRSQNTFIPMIEASPELMRELRPGRDALNNMSQEFRSMYFYWTGGNSAKSLAGNPVCYLHRDEIDKWDAPTNEGDPGELAGERTKNFYNRKILDTCTPTTKQGRIWKAWEKSDKGEFRVPCWSCEFRQWLSFDNVKYEGETVQECAQSARYQCPQCKHAWTDYQRFEAMEYAAKELPDAGWIFTAKGAKDHAPGTAGFHMPSLCSTFVKASDLVSKFMAAKDTPSELRNVVNSWFAQPWEPATVKVRDELLPYCKMGYRYGQDPTECPDIKAMVEGLNSELFGACDVQKTGFFCRVVQYWEGGHSARIARAFVQSWEEVETFFDQHKTRCILVDSGDGNMKSEVYQRCWAAQGRKKNWIPCKGASKRMDGILRIGEVDPVTEIMNPKDVHPDDLLPFVLVNTSDIKFNLIASMSPNAKKKFWLPHDISDPECKQFTSEEFDSEEGKWKVKGANHFLDCEVYCYAAACEAGYCVGIVENEQETDEEKDEHDDDSEK